MILASSWASHMAASSSSGRATPRGVEPRVRGVAEEAPATEPLPRTGELPHSSPASHGAEERLDQALELAHGRSTIRHNLLQVAAGMLGQLGAELADVDSRLEVENLRQAHEWHHLKVAVNLAHLQHERTRKDVLGSLVASREACIHAQEGAQATE